MLFVAHVAVELFPTFKANVFCDFLNDLIDSHENVITGYLRRKFSINRSGIFKLSKHGINAFNCFEVKLNVIWTC